MKRGLKLGFYLAYGLLNVGVFILGFYNIQNILKIYKYTESANLLFFHTSNLNNSIQEFFINDVTDTLFYKNGNSKSIEDYNKYFMLAKSESDEIIHSDIASEFGLNYKINGLIQNYIDYDYNFKKIVQLYKYKGFIDFGEEGAMRKNVHYLENQTNISQEHILRLRRHEKDYLLRKSKKYTEKLYFEIQEIKKEISQSNTPNYKKQLEALFVYETSFKNIVETSEDIEATQHKNQHIMTENINPILGRVINSIKDKKDSMINNCIRDFIIMSIIFMVSTMVIGYKLNQSKNMDIENLEMYLKNIIRRRYYNDPIQFALKNSINFKRTAVYLSRIEGLMKSKYPQNNENIPDETTSRTQSSVQVANSTSKNFIKLI